LPRISILSSRVWDGFFLVKICFEVNYCIERFYFVDKKVYKWTRLFGYRDLHYIIGIVFTLYTYSMLIICSFIYSNNLRVVGTLGLIPIQLYEKKCMKEVGVLTQVPISSHVFYPHFR
jgi:hypothetical protein